MAYTAPSYSVTGDVGVLSPTRKLFCAALLVLVSVIALFTFWTTEAKSQTSPERPIVEAPQKIRTQVKQPGSILPTSLRELRFTINDQQVEGSLRALRHGNQTFLLFSDVLELFNFPIQAEVGQTLWSGFYLTPSNTFRLDTTKHSVNLRGARKVVFPQDIRRYEGKLYVADTLLSDWFGIRSLPNYNANKIDFTTNFILPREAQDLRRRNRLELLDPPLSNKDAPTAPPAVAQGGDTVPEQKHSLSGQTTAGHEVELYRNDELIAFQYAGNDGRYTFDNIPLLGGQNNLRTSIYGPQGQYEERQESKLTSPLPTVSTPPLRPNVSAETKKKETLEQNAQTAMSISATLQAQLAQAQNWQTLTVMQDNASIGALEAYIGPRGTFLRLDSFIRFAGLATNQQPSPEVLDIKMPDRMVRLNLAERNVTDNGQIKTLNDNDAFLNEDKIYANVGFLERIFPDQIFLVDQAQLKVNIKKTALPTLTAQKVSALSDTAPSPSAAPVNPVIIDDMSGTQRISGTITEPTPEAKDVLHLEASAQQTSTTTKPDDESKKEIEPLILQPRLKKLPLSGAFIEALDVGGTVYLPLNDLFQLIGFPIRFDEGMNEAKGSFFEPDNEFLLNINQKEARIKGKALPLTPNDIRKHEGQIFASTQAFKDWFDIDSNIDRMQGTIHLTTDKLLPEEEKQERQKKWNKLISALDNSSEAYPLLRNPYKLLSYPTLDVSLGSSYSHNKISSARKNLYLGNYNLQGAMELGYLTNQIYAQGATNKRALETLRLQAGRKDPDSNLLGYLKATQFAVGDVTSPSVSFVTGNALGRGAMITNRGMTTSENFDVRTFTGDSVPGYEVELYRNNVLLAFQTVDANGRYSFNDIPILYGENTFRLVFYGNQGQREERIETVSASSALLKEGDFEYTVGAEQRGMSLIPLSKLSLSNPKLPDGRQIVSSFRYGVTSNYTIGAALAETRLEDGPHRYFTTSSGANLYGILSETSFAKDIKTGGWASGMSLLTGFEGISLRARYRQYNNFVSETINNLTVPLKSEANINANTQLYLPLLQSFSLGLSGTREKFVDGDLKPRYTFGMQLAKSFWGLSFSNTIDAIIDESKRYQDTFGIQTRLWDINFRATGIYDLKPDSKFRSASFMSDYRLMDRLSGQTQIDKDLSTNKTSLGQNFNWDFDKFRLSLNNQIDNGGNYAIGLNVLFSMNHDALNNKWRAQGQQTAAGGAVAGRVFLDENSNNLLDEGEKLVPEASVRLDRTTVKLDENGFFIAPIAPYGLSKIEVSTDGLDPLLSPQHKGYRLQTRPGDMIVADFPIVRTTIIDGTSYFLEADGTKKEIGNIIVELQDNAGKAVRRVVSEMDGYFSFDKVQKGTYWLSVPDEVLTSLNAKLQNKIQIIIEEIDSFFSDNQIVLEQAVDLTIPPILDTAISPTTPTSPPTLPLPAPPTPPTLPTIAREENKN